MKNLRKFFPDLPDFLVAFGLCLLWYGLFLRSPWVSFAVIGGLLLAGGVYLSIPARRGGG